MSKHVKLDDKAKKALHDLCLTHGYNIKLGDWLDSVDDALAELLAKLDSDTGVTDSDYSTLDTGND